MGYFLRPLTHPTWRSGNHSPGGVARLTLGLRPLCSVDFSALWAGRLLPPCSLAQASNQMQEQSRWGWGWSWSEPKGRTGGKCHHGFGRWPWAGGPGRWPWAGGLGQAFQLRASACLVHNMHCPVPSLPRHFSPERLEAPSSPQHCSPPLSPLHRGGWALLPLRVPATLCKAGCSASWDWRC